MLAQFQCFQFQMSSSESEGRECEEGTWGGGGGLYTELYQQIEVEVEKLTQEN